MPVELKDITLTINGQPYGYIREDKNDLVFTNRVPKPIEDLLRSLYFNHKGSPEPARDSLSSILYDNTLGLAEDYSVKLDITPIKPKGFYRVSVSVDTENGNIVSSFIIYQHPYATYLPPVLVQEDLLSPPYHRFYAQRLDYVRHSSNHDEIIASEDNFQTIVYKLKEFVDQAANRAVKKYKIAEADAYFLKHDLFYILLRSFTEAVINMSDRIEIANYDHFILKDNNNIYIFHRYGYSLFEYLRRKHNAPLPKWLYNISKLNYFIADIFRQADDSAPWTGELVTSPTKKYSLVVWKEPKRVIRPNEHSGRYIINYITDDIALWAPKSYDSKPPSVENCLVTVNKITPSYNLKEVDRMQIELPIEPQKIIELMDKYIDEPAQRRQFIDSLHLNYKRLRLLIDEQQLITKKIESVKDASSYSVEIYSNSHGFNYKQSIPKSRNSVDNALGFTVNTLSTLRKLVKKLPDNHNRTITPELLFNLIYWREHLTDLPAEAQAVIEMIISTKKNTQFSYVINYDALIANLEEIINLQQEEVPEKNEYTENTDISLD